MEELITRGENFEFNQEIFREGGLIRAKHYSWREPRNGIIIFAGKNSLQAIYLPKIGGATCYFSVKATEAAAGLWEIFYTNDLQNVYELQVEPEEETDLPSAVRKIFEEEKQNGDNES